MSAIAQVPICFHKTVAHQRKTPRGRCRRRGPSRANFTLAICASHSILVRCGSALVTAALLGRFLPGLGPLAIASGPFFISIASSNSRRNHTARRGSIFQQSGNSAPPNKHPLLRGCREGIADDIPRLFHRKKRCRKRAEFSAPHAFCSSAWVTEAADRGRRPPSLH
jgi:hypothetical protein